MVMMIMIVMVILVIVMVAVVMVIVMVVSMPTAMYSPIDGGWMRNRHQTAAATIFFKCRLELVSVQWAVRSLVPCRSLGGAVCNGAHMVHLFTAARDRALVCWRVDGGLTQFLPGAGNIMADVRAFSRLWLPTQWAYV